MPNIYTRTGDGGETGLCGGRRVRKDDPCLEVIGALDELNAMVGVVRVELGRLESAPTDLGQFCERVQHQLFNLGAELATAQPEQTSGSLTLIQDADVAALEQAIDRWDVCLEPLREFILPGGCPPAAQLHLARCVCRRAERLLVRLSTGERTIRGEVLRYINRLSDALFVAARLANRAAGTTDVKWRPDL
ncbi:MAG TPA: cob(I)yrinic acid a,c-diamide adenosyltransferase [Lacipirellulaceae bacterium]|jgi:cob(I)alamin adenosyltransferase